MLADGQRPGCCCLPEGLQAFLTGKVDVLRNFLVSAVQQRSLGLQDGDRWFIRQSIFSKNDDSESFQNHKNRLCLHEIDHQSCFSTLG
jgi:hypothetical protein